MSKKDRSMLFSVLHDPMLRKKQLKEEGLGKKQLKEEGLIFFSQFEGTVPSAREGTAWGTWQECGTISIYTVPAVREQKEKLRVQHLSHGRHSIHRGWFSHLT